MTDKITLLQPAVFLGWPLGTKGTKKRWKHLKQADMTPSYLKRLEGGNVGVAFGAVSANADGHALAGIDLDRADVVEAFLTANPRLRGGWLSRGRPDRLLVIVRIAGNYPKSCKLVDGDKQPIGEWRVDERCAEQLERRQREAEERRNELKRQPARITQAALCCVNSRAWENQTDGLRVTSRFTGWRG